MNVARRPSPLHTWQHIAEGIHRDAGGAGGADSLHPFGPVFCVFFGLMLDVPWRLSGELTFSSLQDGSIEVEHTFP